jgi:imidazolonepropionase-like amidohydrolase
VSSGLREAEAPRRQTAHRACPVATCHNAAVGFDLVIRGATVVTPGHREAVDIGIAGGRIAQLGGTMTGAEELAAGGLLAIPGGVDAHTHLVHQGLGRRPPGRHGKAVISRRAGRQIAKTLYIREKTASVHVSNILRKLGVTSRVQAATAAARLRL